MASPRTGFGWQRGVKVAEREKRGKRPAAMARGRKGGRGDGEPKEVRARDSAMADHGGEVQRRRERGNEGPMAASDGVQSGGEKKSYGASVSFPAAKGKGTEGNPSISERLNTVA
ncbi:hypothetical protein E2562_017448 [Oryza meyeriana var. granulata]|uniref:DUF834 domain-containing protein n=1 Tax=Oryza meyeriana var. granulata TaxID=110450 RepID=A0A6G1DXP5_9ORYZ|nr:hypothetical protein E2562_017448 [Oryza meyeriana var. granulata]